MKVPNKAEVENMTIFEKRNVRTVIAGRNYVTELLHLFKAFTYSELTLEEVNNGNLYECRMNLKIPNTYDTLGMYTEVNINISSDKVGNLRVELENVVTDNKHLALSFVQTDTDITFLKNKFTYTDEDCFEYVADLLRTCYFTNNEPLMDFDLPMSYDNKEDYINKGINATIELINYINNDLGGCVLDLKATKETLDFKVNQRYGRKWLTSHKVENAKHIEGFNIAMIKALQA